MLALLEECRALAEPHLTYRLCYRELPLTVTADTCLAGGITLPSAALARHLAGCERVIVFAATVGLGLAVGSFALYEYVFWEVFFNEWVAQLCLVLCLLLSLLPTLITALLTGMLALSTAFAVGNEQLPLTRCVALSWRRSIRHIGTLLLFALRTVWHLLLSLCTVGVLHLLWYGHHNIISYLCLAMALDQGD